MSFYVEKIAFDLKGNNKYENRGQKDRNILSIQFICPFERIQNSGNIKTALEFILMRIYRQK